MVFLTSKRETRHIFEKIIADFNESQDEIYVEHMEVPNPEQELQIRAIQGEFPDIVEFIGAQNDNLEKYVKGGYLQELNDFSATHCVNEHFLEKLKILNGTYVLPLSVNYRGIFYNKRMLEEDGYQIPSTYAELIDTMEQIKKQESFQLFLQIKTAGRFTRDGMQLTCLQEEVGTIYFRRC
ncbi:MAG: ABC transporter substrate-binding protein [Ruminococcus sp.]